MAQTIIVDKSALGRTLKASPDDLLDVRLEENPTTGYLWEIAHVDDRILELLSSDYVMAPGTGIGRGGMRTIRFRVKSTGTGRLHLRLRRRWDPEDTALQSFEVTINVQ